MTSGSRFILFAIALIVAVFVGPYLVNTHQIVSAIIVFVSCFLTMVLALVPSFR